ncbi:MAG TPA: PEGA domain-containing protein [Polyangiaceae bacterium]|nr:PEGA domain-containing protein [Polyangiaceae bacterium]
MRHLFAGLFVAGTFAATLALSPSALAQPPKPATATTATTAAPAAAAAPNLAEAKKHYGEGEKKYKAGDFAGALPEFQAADAVKSTPQSQRYIGLCQDNLGHYADAVAAYEKFLAAVPAKMKKEGDEIAKRVEQIKAMPAHLHVESTPTGASIVIDGKPMGTTPADVDVAAGKHILHIELPGYLPNDRDLDLAYAAKQDIKAELQAKPAEAAAPVATAPTPVMPPKAVEPVKPEGPKEGRSKLPAFITGGLAIVAVGIGTGFGIAALDKKSQFDKTPTADLADTGENFALVADMAFGVAITLGVTSVVLFLTNDEDAAPKSASAPARTTAKKHPVRIIPTPFITPNGGGAGALLRF